MAKDGFFSNQSASLITATKLSNSSSQYFKMTKMFYLCSDVLISPAHLSPSLITCIGMTGTAISFSFLLLQMAGNTRTHTGSQAHRQQSSGRTISADLKCHGSLRHPTSGRLWPRFGHARLNRSRTGCLFTQCRDRDGSLGATAKPKKKKKTLHGVAQTSTAGARAHAQTAQRDRWGKTQRSAVSRASLRQDSASFTSP